MSPPSIDVSGKSATQLLQEARRLLDERPRRFEPIADIEGRRIAAAWLIAEADFQRVSAALSHDQARGGALDPKDIDPDRKVMGL